MKLLSFLLVITFLCVACPAQSSALPKDIPAGLSVSYHQDGAMNRSSRKFEIENDVLSFEELRSQSQPKITWTSKVDVEEIEELYTAFRANAFDLIENDKRQGIVHDAGSESIAISFGVGKFYRITYGHNSPLSGSSLERYRAVKKALDELLGRHRPSPGTDAGEERLHGIWRVAGERDGHAWFLQWKFEDGTFEQRGYPPVLQKGRYRITKFEGDRLIIELSDQEGTFGTANRTMRIAFDASDEAIAIDGRFGFKRIEN